MSSYVWVHFLRSKDSAKVDELGQWLKDCELPSMCGHPAVKQATLYKDLHFPEMHQPDYYTLYRFEALHYEKIRDEIKEQFRQAVKESPEPKFLEREQNLFYEESHKYNRVQPRIPAYAPAFAGPVFKKYAMYGFSHSADEKRREEFIQWYQAERQHDVVREFFPFDNGRMWLLCSGEEYPEYIFTMYEYSPSDFMRAMDVLQGAYAVISQVRGTDLYVTGYAGALDVMAELIKEY